MRHTPTLAAALIALGGAGVASSDGERVGAVAGTSSNGSGVVIVKSDGGGYEVLRA